MFPGLVISKSKPQLQDPQDSSESLNEKAKYEESMNSARKLIHQYRRILLARKKKKKS